MKLSDKQWLFLQNVAKLIQYINELNLKATGGDLFRDERCPYGSKSSLHHRRLAIDLNLFVNDEYQTTGEHFLPLGEFWEAMPHCKWGGRFGDYNHFEWSDIQWQDESLEGINQELL